MLHTSTTTVLRVQVPYIIRRHFASDDASEAAYAAQPPANASNCGELSCLGQGAVGGTPLYAISCFSLRSDYAPNSISYVTVKASLNHFPYSLSVLRILLLFFLATPAPPRHPSQKHSFSVQTWLQPTQLLQALQSFPNLLIGIFSMALLE